MTKCGPKSSVFCFPPVPPSTLYSLLAPECLVPTPSPPAAHSGAFKNPESPLSSYNPYPASCPGSLAVCGTAHETTRGRKLQVCLPGPQTGACTRNQPWTPQNWLVHHGRVLQFDVAPNPGSLERLYQQTSVLDPVLHQRTKGERTSE